VLFLADGRIVDEMSASTADSGLDRIKALGPSLPLVLDSRRQ
jgi:hypothetical protein